VKRQEICRKHGIAHEKLAASGGWRMPGRGLFCSCVTKRMGTCMQGFLFTRAKARTSKCPKMDEISKLPRKFMVSLVAQASRRTTPPLKCLSTLWALEALLCCKLQLAYLVVFIKSCGKPLCGGQAAVDDVRLIVRLVPHHRRISNYKHNLTVHVLLIFLWKGSHSSALMSWLWWVIK